MSLFWVIVFLDFFFSKKLGKILAKKYKTANIKELKASTSHVPSKPSLSFNAPPKIGAIMQPIAYDVLNIPDALSFNTGFSPIFSFSYTAAIISESRGTKMNATDTPRQTTPAIVTPSVLIKIRLLKKIWYYYSG